MRTKEQIERLEQLTETLAAKVAALEKEVEALKAPPSGAAESASSPPGSKSKSAARKTRKAAE